MVQKLGRVGRSPGEKCIFIVVNEKIRRVKVVPRTLRKESKVFREKVASVLREEYKEVQEIFSGQGIECMKRRMYKPFEISDVAVDYTRMNERVDENSCALCYCCTFCYNSCKCQDDASDL